MNTGQFRENDIVHQDAFYAVGLAYEGPMADDGRIPRLWEEFLDRVPEIKRRTTKKELLGIAQCTEEQKKKGEMFYLAAARVEQINYLPQGMTAKVVEGGGFLKALHKGPVSKIRETIGFFADKLVPARGYSVDRRPLIEIYDERYKGEAQDSVIEILIPLGEKT